MDPYWQIKSWPTCQFHIFLSHVREDIEWLVKPLDEELQRRQIIAWGDWKLNFVASAEDAFAFFREKILQSRHIVYLVTPHALGQGRGWMAAERAYAAHLQSQLLIDSFQAACLEKLILTVSKTDEHLSQSVWYPLINLERSVAITDAPEILITRCADEIQKFIEVQERDGIARLEAIRQDPMLTHHLQLTQSLEHRISCADPPPHR